MEGKTAVGHISAAVTVFVWGTTFIATKVLLVHFQPIEILFFRFVLGLAALTVVYPKPIRRTTAKREVTFAAAGLTGITLYYLLENIALTCTKTANVGVIVSVAPFFTALLTAVVTRDKSPLSLQFFVGFLLAMGGICLTSFGSGGVEFHPLGDGMALLAAAVWAVYSVLIRRIGAFGYTAVQTTRRVFAYGTLFMIPALFFFDFNWDLTRLSNIGDLLNLLFLGLGASAAGFAVWSFAVKRLGAVTTSVYIYMIPVVTVVASALVLHEPLTLQTIVGTLLTLLGLVLSQVKFPIRKQKSTTQD